MKQKIVIISQEKELREYETSKESLIFGSLIWGVMRAEVDLLIVLQ